MIIKNIDSEIDYLKTEFNSNFKELYETESFSKFITSLSEKRSLRVGIRNGIELIVRDVNIGDLTHTENSSFQNLTNYGALEFKKNDNDLYFGSEEVAKASNQDIFLAIIGENWLRNDIGNIFVDALIFSNHEIKDIDCFYGSIRISLTINQFKFIKQGTIAVLNKSANNKSVYLQTIAYKQDYRLELENKKAWVFTENIKYFTWLKESKSYISIDSLSQKEKSNIAYFKYSTSMRIRQHSQDFQKAIDYLNISIDLTLQFHEKLISTYLSTYYYERSLNYFDLMNYEKSAQDYKKFIEFNDFTERKRFFIGGRSKYNQKKFEEAISIFERELLVNNNSIDTLFYRGLSYYNLKNYQIAKIDFDKVIELNPCYLNAYENRGNVRYYLDDYNGAIEDYNKAIEINPNDYGVYNNRGNVKYHLVDYYGAIEDYNKAIEINPNDYNAYNYRGVVKHHLDDYNGAIEDYSKAIKLNTTGSIYYQNRAKAKDRIGLIDSAEKDRDTARELRKNHEL